MDETLDFRTYEMNGSFLQKVTEGLFLQLDDQFCLMTQEIQFLIEEQIKEDLEWIDFP